ncbi:MAG: DUF2306 domain-containing protein [Nitrospira sp.]|nr:DUF2306 domain-containing protein [Nitrospira sp.]MDP3089191.1 DUF2306 domain-containing protein [Nitrospira sp.]
MSLDHGVMRLAGFIALVVLSLAVAGYALAVYGFLPVGALVHPDMRATFEAHPVGIYAHVFGAAVALALGPFQFSSTLRDRRPALHRRLGRLYLAIGVLIGGLSGLFMAFHAFGGLPSRLGFACLAVAWLYSGSRAYFAVRACDFTAHRCWMVRNFALTFAAVTLRLYLPASVALGAAFEIVYPIIAWLCWLPNLVAAECLVNRATHPLIERPNAGFRPSSAAHSKG